MISGVTYIIAGVLAFAGLSGLIALPVGAALMAGFLFVMRQRQSQ